MSEQQDQSVTPESADQAEAAIIARGEEVIATFLSEKEADITHVDAEELALYALEAGIGADDPLQDFLVQNTDADGRVDVMSLMRYRAERVSGVKDVSNADLLTFMRQDRLDDINRQKLQEWMARPPEWDALPIIAGSAGRACKAIGRAFSRGRVPGTKDPSQLTARDANALATHVVRQKAASLYASSVGLRESLGRYREAESLGERSRHAVDLKNRLEALHLSLNDVDIMCEGSERGAVKVPKREMKMLREKLHENITPVLSEIAAEKDPAIGDVGKMAEKLQLRVKKMLERLKQILEAIGQMFGKMLGGKPAQAASPAQA